MRLIVECKHGDFEPHIEGYSDGTWGQCGPTYHTEPDAILAALADAGVLELEVRGFAGRNPQLVTESANGTRTRYVSPWKETEAP